MDSGVGLGESVEVVTSELIRAADRLRGAGQQLQDGLSSVDLETSNLLAAGWQGDAATAFEKYWDQWHNGAGQVVRALQTMSDALEVAAKNYAATDEQAGSALASTMQGAGGSGAGGGGAPTGGGAGAGAPTVSQPGLAEQMNLGQATQPQSQAAGIPAQFASQAAGGLSQAGAIAAGAAQQAVQLATQLAQQAEAAEAGKEAVDADKKSEDGPEGAAGGEAPAGPAPVEAPREDPSPSGPESAPGRTL